jgi:maleylacetate reductase
MTPRPKLFSATGIASRSSRARCTLSCVNREDIHMLQSGRVVFSQMEQVLFGIPAAQAVAELAQDAQRVLLMVSGTLNQQTDEIEKVRRALGNRCVGTFDRMPPHTPRSAVIAAAEQARGLGADLIVTVGGGSITDGAKAVQLCLANDIRTPEAIDTLRPVDGNPPPC